MWCELHSYCQAKDQIVIDELSTHTDDSRRELIHPYKVGQGQDARIKTYKCLTRKIKWLLSTTDRIFSICQNNIFKSSSQFLISTIYSNLQTLYGRSLNYVLKDNLGDNWEEACSILMRLASV